MTFRFSYSNSRLGWDVEIEASDYDAAKAQLLSDKPGARITAVEVKKNRLKLSQEREDSA